MTTNQSQKRREAADLLREIADSLNAALEQGQDSRAKAAKGQFTTPSDAGRSIAELVDLRLRDEIRIADAGAGAGALTLCLLAKAIERGVTGAISVDLIENDPSAIDLLAKATEAATMAADAHGLSLSIRIVEASFLDPDSWGGGDYDLVIMNPPYMKLAQKSHERTATQRLTGVDCPNIYAAFLTTAMQLLKPEGQLVAITPRSFANGRYFLDFRRHLLDVAAFSHVILFDRRDKIFRASSVLQETVIFKLVKRTDSDATPEAVLVETRTDHESEPHQAHEVEQSSISDPDDPDCFINLPGSADVMEVAQRIRAHPETLATLGLSISTGPVVDFRAKEYLSDPETSGAVPLIYPSNIRAGEVRWPVAGKKPQGFKKTPQSERQLYPNGHYVLVKRFTSKEETRRVVAAVFHPIDGHTSVAFENHVNVIHQDRQPLTVEVANEVADYLNTEDVDTFFRMFSGSTQVNATDLRRLGVPFTKTDPIIIELRNETPEATLFNQEAFA